MEFSINKLDGLDYEELEPLLSSYIKIIRNQFHDSPEGKSYVEAFPNHGAGWIEPLIELGVSYGEGTLPEMTHHNVKTLIEELFPRKISLMNREETKGAIEELIAFWSFLKREYSLENADLIIGYLKRVEPRFADIMFDSSKFGMAKSLLMGGLDMGFDMTSEAGIGAFMNHYNSNVAPELRRTGGTPRASDERYIEAIAKAKKAKNRKKNAMAKASRRKNRK